MNLIEKLAAIKAQLKKLPKDAHAYGYDYTSGEAVLDMINPLFNEAKVICYPEITGVPLVQQLKVQTKNGVRDEALFQFPVRYVFVNAEDSKDRLEVPWYAAGQNDAEKGFGSALTYAERYFFRKFFQIASEEDAPEQRKPAETQKQAAQAQQGQGKGATPGKFQAQPAGSPPAAAGPKIDVRKSNIDKGIAASQEIDAEYALLLSEFGSKDWSELTEDQRSEIYKILKPKLPV